jgi:hypothetical protein
VNPRATPTAAGHAPPLQVDEPVMQEFRVLWYQLRELEAENAQLKKQLERQK